MCIVQYTWLVKRHKRFFPGVEKKGKGRNFAFFAFFYLHSYSYRVSMRGPEGSTNQAYPSGFYSKRISKRGSVLKLRGGCYNYRFKLYK